MTCKRLHRVNLAAALGLLAATLLSPAEPAAAGQSALRVAKNGAAVIDLEAEAGAVTVVNPEIADVTPLGGKRLIVLGRAVGQTDLLIYDRAGVTLLSTALVVTPQTERTVVINRGIEEDTLVCAPLCASISPRQAAPPAGGGALPGVDAMKKALEEMKPK